MTQQGSVPAELGKCSGQQGDVIAAAFILAQIPVEREMLPLLSCSR